MKLKAICSTILLALGIFVGAVPAQEFNGLEPPQLALPAQRLLLEQVEQLGQAGQIDEALAILEKLHDEADGRLVRLPDVAAAATLQTQRFVPLSLWTGVRERSLLAQFPAAVERYQARKLMLAQAALEELQIGKEPLAVKRAARRFAATSLGPQMQLMLSDLYLEYGWGVAAAQAADQVSSLNRRGVAGGSLPWPLVWKQLTSQSSAASDQLAAHWAHWQELRAAAMAADSDATAWFLKTMPRLLAAANIDRQALPSAAMRAWAAAIVDRLPPAETGTLRDIFAKSESWPALASPQSDGWWNVERAVDKALWPAWTQALEKYSANSDLTPASKPRVAERERGTLPYFPVVADGRVYVNEMTRILAFDLHSGRPWPDIRPALPLYDSQTSPAAYIPLGYPLVGTPKGTLQIADGCLYARMGSPLTGRANSRGNSTESASYLVGLDLNKQGSLLAGFPLHLNAPEFVSAEFDGPPLVWGNLLIVAVAERDNVGMLRRLAAFDRFSGELVWKTEALAVGSVAGSQRANLISHQAVTSAGGRLYYATNLGSIACIDPLNGETEWLVQYSRPPTTTSYPKPDRFRYRDYVPCLVAGGLVYCAPQDAPEIFALDALSGDLVWSTDDTQVADAVHLLGVHDDCLLVSGDRLVWLDQWTGAHQGSFPATTTPGAANGLPSPRGLGRGRLAGDRVFFPVAGEVLVFSASLPARPATAPAVLQKFRLDSRGHDGGNLQFAEDWLLITTPSRLMAFQDESGHNSY